MNKKNKPLQEEAQKIYTEEQKQDLTKSKAEQDILSLTEQRIDRKQISLISQAQYKLDTDKSLYDHLQGFLDNSFDKQKYKGKSQIHSGLVVYEDRRHKTEVVFEGNFEVAGSYNFNAQTEKIKDALEEALVTQYQETQNPTIFISIKKLAEEINVRPTDLRKRIKYIIESLQTIRISYTTKDKLKKVYSDFASLRIISSFEYHSDTDLLEVNFDNKYAYNLAVHKFFQLPKKYRQINDNAYQYAYPLAKYVFELCKHNRNKITFKSLYEQIRKIPRIEDLRKSRQSPTQKIYEPLMKHFVELNRKEDFIIAFENQDFLIQNDAKKTIDFDKMLETNIIITWKNKPNYKAKDNKKTKQQQKIISSRNELIEKAMRKTIA